MEITTENFKEWLLLLSDFTWPVVAVVVLIIYRDAVIHLLKRIIDLIFGK